MEKIEKTTSIRGLETEYVPHAEFAGISKEIFTLKKGVNIETLYQVIKISPELTGCITAVTEDIMADGWRFDGRVDPVKKAEDFQIKSKFYKILANAILDLLITGNAYILKLSVDEDKVKDILATLTKTIAQVLSVKIDKKMDYKVLKQDVKKPNDLQLLKASTVQINFDKTGEISSFEQKVQTEKRVYIPEDIIHLTLLNIGGQPYGFTPMEPLLSDIGTLIFAKEFAGKYFENDGIPYFIMNLPEDNPDSRNYKNLKKELKELKKSKNKYRVLLTTGKLTTEQINKFNKDMEYVKLIQHFTQIILMAMGVPAHRINLTIDVKQIGGAVNRAYEGYYKKIGFMQKIFENLFNSELWNYFNVKMKFKRAYKIDEMREAQIAQIAAQVGFMTIEEIRERIGLEPELPKGKKGEKTGDDKGIDFKEDKRQEQGRELDDDKTDNKVKQFSGESRARPSKEEIKELEEKKELKQDIKDLLIFQREFIKQKIEFEKPKEVQTEKPEEPKQKEIPDEEKRKAKFINDAAEVTWPMFRVIVEGKVGKDGFDLAKILYIETEDSLILFFSDDQWRYRTIISKKTTDIEKFKVENLRYAIRIFI